MLRTILCCGLCVASAACFAHDPQPPFPAPHYQKIPGDPPWLDQVVRFHGHLGPAVVAGARLGAAGVQAVGATGYFDVEVACEGPFARPPASCFLDGVQVATGATLGKRNLHCADAREVVVRVKNTRTGKSAEVRPNKKLLQLLEQAKKHDRSKGDHRQLEQIAREISVLPDKEAFTVIP